MDIIYNVRERLSQLNEFCCNVIYEMEIYYLSGYNCLAIKNDYYINDLGCLIEMKRRYKIL